MGLPGIHDIRRRQELFEGPSQQEIGMKLTSTAFALLLAASGLTMAAPAVAQEQKADPAAAEAKKPKVSSNARNEIVALQTAVNAKNAAAIPAALAAAQAKAKTKDDQYIVAQLQLKAAVDANDTAGMMTGLQAVLNSGWLAPADISCAAIVIAFDVVRGLLNRSVEATIPVKNAVAICSSNSGLSLFSESLRPTSISPRLLAFCSCQSMLPKSLLVSPTVTVATVASCKIRPCALKA